MREKYKKQKMFIVILAIFIMGIIEATSVYAYFSADASASSSMHIDLQDAKPQIFETKGNNQIKLTIKNTEKSDAYIRIKAITPSSVNVTYSSNVASSNDGYYYYADVVLPGSSTNEITINFNTSRTEHYKSIIVAETISASYDEQGSPYANWNATLE